MRTGWLVLVMMLAFSLTARAADYPEKWVYLSTSITDSGRIDSTATVSYSGRIDSTSAAALTRRIESTSDQSGGQRAGRARNAGARGSGLEYTLDIMKQAKECGCTHVQLNEGMMARLESATPEYLANVKKVLDAAREMNLKIVPGVYAIGYSGRYLGRDPNLAAGIPVKDAPFVVKGSTATPAPSLALDPVNAGFEDFKGENFRGWTAPKYPGFIAGDTEVKHSGNASLRISDIDRLPKESEGELSISQSFKVKPFQYYVVSVWTKSKDLDTAGENYIVVTSLDGKRRNSWTNLGVRSDEDWTQHFTMFNTLQATEIVLSVGVGEGKGGTIWFDDLEIAPAGLTNVVRREPTPLTVTSEDRTATYVEGKDFEPIKGMAPGSGGRFRAPEAQQFVLTPTSRIKDGQTILVSYFHTMRIYGDQMVISMEDPKVFDIMDDQMKRMAEVWPTNAYFMNYDEIRIGGWENQPGGAHLKPGEELARHVARGVEIIRKYAPKADIYVWSDMFSPYHNARPFDKHGYYYLVNGNWDGSWEGLPKDVIIANWFAPSHESMTFFSDRGYKQFMCGYYDGDLKSNIQSWMDVSKGVPNVLGMMYTTWHRNYTDMPEFFRLLKEYPAWAKVESTESSLKEK